MSQPTNTDDEPVERFVDAHLDGEDTPIVLFVRLSDGSLGLANAAQVAAHIEREKQKVLDAVLENEKPYKLFTEAEVEREKVAARVDELIRCKANAGGLQNYYIQRAIALTGGSDE